MMLKQVRHRTSTRKLDDGGMDGDGNGERDGTCKIRVDAGYLDTSGN